MLSLILTKIFPSSKDDEIIVRRIFSHTHSNVSFTHLPPSLSLFGFFFNWYVRDAECVSVSAWVFSFASLVHEMNTPVRHIIALYLLNENDIERSAIIWLRILETLQIIINWCDSRDILSMSGVWFHIDWRKTKTRTKYLSSRYI